MASEYVKINSCLISPFPALRFTKSKSRTMLTSRLLDISAGGKMGGIGDLNLKAAERR